MGAISKVLRESRSDGYRLLLFRCPGCNEFHGVCVSRPDGQAGPVWEWDGNVDKPTFTPSLLVTWRTPKGHSNDNPAPVGWKGEYVNKVCHSFIRDGRIQFLGDCTHSLAGQTIDIPELPDHSEEKGEQ